MAFIRHFALWLLLFVSLGRFQEIFPFLAPFRLGLLSLGFGGIIVLSSNAQDLTIMLRKTPIKKCIIAIIALGFFSIPFSVYKGNAIGQYQGYLRLLLSISIVIALGKNNLRSVQLCLISILLLISIQMITTSIGGRTSVSSTYDPNDIGLLCVVYLPFAIQGIMQKNIILKILSITAAGGGVASIALTGSRGGFLGLVAIGIYCIILTKKRRMLLIALAIVGAAVFGAMAGDELWVRFRGLFDGTDYNLSSSGDSRLAIWTNAVEVMIRRPFFGVGIGQFVTGIATLTDSPWKTAHNSFLQIGVELGVGGFIAFCGIFYYMFKLSLMGSKAEFFSPSQQSLYTYLRMSILGFCVSGFFLSHAYSYITYTLVAIGYVMYMEYEKYESRAAQENLSSISNTDEHIQNAPVTSKLSEKEGGDEKSSTEKFEKIQQRRRQKKSRLETGDLLRRQKTDALGK